MIKISQTDLKVLVSCSRHCAAHPASEVPNQVGPTQGQPDDHQHHPLQLEGEQGGEEQQSLKISKVSMKIQNISTNPNNRRSHKSSPENLNLCFRKLDLSFLTTGLEHPHRLSRVVDIVPPPEARHDPTSDVLDGPEVKREKKNDGNKASNETVREPTTQEVGYENCCKITNSHPTYEQR